MVAIKLLSVCSLLILTILSEAQETNFIQIPIIDNDIYSIEYAVEGDKITFQAIVQSIGFVGFGLSNVTGMVDSDIFIAGVNPEGVPYSGDYDSVDAGVPKLDTIQNWDLIDASEQDGVTSITFSRLLDTGDWAQDVTIEDKDVILIWAIGPNDNVVPASYHGPNRGSIVFNLLNPAVDLPTESAF